MNTENPNNFSSLHFYEKQISSFWNWFIRRTRTLCFKLLSVVANTTVAEASQQLVIQALVPFRTHSSPSCRACVDAAPASLPFPLKPNTSSAHFIPNKRSLVYAWTRQLYGSIDVEYKWNHLNRCVTYNHAPVLVKQTDLMELQLCLPGSLRAKQPTLSPVVKGVIHCFFCSSVPNFRIGPRYRD